MNVDFGLALLRIVIGLLFIGHGSQKLFGAFGGHGLDVTSGYFGSMGVRQPRRMATMVGLSELGGGAGLALGLLTPLACAAIAAVMLGAIVLAHWPKFWVTEEGMEYPLVNLVIATAFGIAGPGGWSLDAVIGTEDLLPNPWTYAVAGAIAAVSVAFTVAQHAGDEEMQAAEEHRQAA